MSDQKKSTRRFLQASQPLHGDGSRWTRLRKAEVPKILSNAQDLNGLQPHPVDYEAIRDFKDYNPWHSTCIEAKKNATVGLGFKNDKIKSTLDSKCEENVLVLLNDIAEDFWQVGNGYMEVVRDEAGAIVMLYPLKAENVYVVLEEDNYNFHYRVYGEDVAQGTLMARFGDREDFRARLPEMLEYEAPDPDEPETISEIIHFKRPSSKSRWYGYPDWLGATPFVELAQCATQYNFDFYMNRGVPEFLIVVTGGQVGEEDWEVIEDIIRGGIGTGNSHKSAALNLPDENTKVEIHKLASDIQSEGSFKDAIETTSLAIVSAHRVPPLLAGIQIPGKLGATNELPNALMAFQILCIAQAQKVFCSTLANTLGDNDLAGLGLNESDFTGSSEDKGNGMNTIVEELNLDVMDTVGGMRQSLPAAQAEGRDLTAGKKD